VGKRFVDIIPACSCTVTPHNAVVHDAAIPHRCTTTIQRCTVSVQRAIVRRSPGAVKQNTTRVKGLNGIADN